MDVTTSLPDVGVEVPLPEHADLSFVDDLSVTQLAYVTLFFKNQLVARAAEPASFHEFAQYTLAAGEDWSGFNGTSNTRSKDPSDSQATADEEHSDEPVAHEKTDEQQGNAVPNPPVPQSPENIWDTIPIFAEITRQLENAQDAVVTHFCRQLQPAFSSQPEYFGSPVGVVAYKNSTEYFKEVLRFSRTKTKQIHARIEYVTWKAGINPSAEENQPKLSNLAESFKDGKVSGENLDRIIRMDADLTKYTRKVGADLGYKDAALIAFEPTLVEAAETSNPDAFNTARKRWADTIAHHICSDGPPLEEAFRKQADNVLRDQAYSDGSGKAWMHMSPAVFAEYKSFALEQLNKNGAPVKVDDNLKAFLFDQKQEEAKPQTDTADSQEPTNDNASTATNQESNVGEFDTEPLYDPDASNLEDLTIDQDPDSVVAKDSNGDPVTQEELDHIEKLSPGQLLGAIFIGLFRAIRKFPPGELAIKRAHGASSTLHIVQDIETAYQTLDIGMLPEKLRRPRGPSSIVPPEIRRSDPESTQQGVCYDPRHQAGQSPPPWTGFISEAMNVGSIRPQDIKILTCDSEIVGQIWNKYHSVLNQHRTKRFFNRAQRRAILARDRGCRAPGCTIVAALCDIHHIKPWEFGGKTDIDNGITLCTYHHSQVHNGKWTIHTIDGTHYFQPARWLDPYQPLLRNIQWAL
ncbi:MAG TPA: HNH endonuclease [Enteractinococcus helveticum]|uniref:HNH endonuclease n=1 Tax=Enteractinococcus helveticum TaxID=1837282 RepID=A0A921K7K9_9MICC|nr:HNH endonuclease signature motif containing protein [Enteractinococcus helveticum]HJF14810.1 HNH endonuclease [Enteractinococcus helveticum]